MDRTLKYRKKYRGVIGIESKIPIVDQSVLSLIYTPGVAEPCRRISEDPTKTFDYTCRGNTVAIITDGSRVLGLGNMGPLAALPIIEGKSVIFKTFGGVDAFPICLNTQKTEEIVQVATQLAPTFGAICIEDIAAPKCFTIQHHLREALGIPVFHNDQHGAAIEVLAALYNSTKLIGKKMEDLKVLINGAGAAGISVANILVHTGVKDVTLCDTHGLIHQYRSEGMNWAKFAISRKTNRRLMQGSLADGMKNADVFIGLSIGGIVTKDIIAEMNKDAVVLALAVPDPEILPEEAKEGGARIVATGRSDYPNEVNIALVFPGFFRGLLDVAAENINMEMMVSAAKALADMVPEGKLSENYILPQVFDYNVAPAIACAVARSAIETGVALKKTDPLQIKENLETFIYEGSFPVLPESRGKALSLNEKALELHERYRGVVQVKVKIPVKDPAILGTLYLPPGAGLASKEIVTSPLKVFDYTCKSNLVAVVSDGSAVLGLGNIGPRAALPVMEGKAVLFHTFAGVEAFPICIATQDPEEIIDLVKAISPSFGGINLEDISAPRCFMIENRLKEETDIPIFHDDQHGTAVVVLAGLTNALKLVGRKNEELKVVVNGAGAAATAVSKLLISSGVKNLIICDTKGIIYQGRASGMNWMKEEIAKITNPDRIKGNLKEAVKGADVFIGLSVEKALNPDMVKSMNKKPIVFALANPNPEIMPDEAKEAGAYVIATGRSDFPNQVNNSLAFPGIFRGALDVRAININEEMKIAAAYALAGIIDENKLHPDYIIPAGLDFSVPPRVAAAVAQAAMSSGVARKTVDPKEIERSTRKFIYEGSLTLSQ